MMEGFMCYNYKNSRERDYHAHNSIELSYLLKGKWTFVVGETEISMKKGDVIIVDSSIPHRYINASENTHCVGFEFDKTFTELSCMFNLNLEENYYKLISNHAFIGNIVVDVVEGFYDSREYSELQYGIKYILNILNNYKSIETTTIIKRYLMENYVKDCSLDELASYFHISKVHLQRLFKKGTGITIGKYLTGIRMKQAVYLLNNTNISIEDIRIEVGINSRQNFNNLFKKYYGSSPSSIRKNI